MSMAVFDARPCRLGEGPLWHPERGQLFWFDILARKMLSRSGEHLEEWAFDRHVSAAGWVDRHTLLIATETDLIRFDLLTGESVRLVALEENNSVTRSNDGRADPRGGFWIGTMGKNAEPGAGALYRFYNGALSKLRGEVTIPNATCFSPDGRMAYFADTAAHLVWRVALDVEGWPTGDWQVFLDHRERGLRPDGAVIDSAGRFVCAEWGASRVAVYGPDGAFIEAFPVPAAQTTCPAFGGPDLKALHVTTATIGLSKDALEAAPLSGRVFSMETTIAGQAEHQVLL